MKREQVLFCLLPLLIIIIQSCSSQKYVTLGDPTIFFHEGIYYLYGTGSKNGFKVYISKDKKHWSKATGNKNGYALRKEDVYGDHGFWAPQVFQHLGNFYMAYTANEHLAIAKSNSPLGPFVQEDKKPIQSNFRQIDPYVFIEDDKIYLYYVKVANGGNRIFVTELNDDFTPILNTDKKCIEATEAWENVDNNIWSVTEGPSLLKFNSKYYLIYSANHFKSPDYSVGYAVSDTPNGPWIKDSANPILHKKLINMNGSGHGDFFKDKDGWNYVFHTHFSEGKVNPRKTAIIEAKWKDGEKGYKELSLKPETMYFLKLNQLRKNK